MIACVANGKRMKRGIGWHGDAWSMGWPLPSSWLPAYELRLASPKPSAKPFPPRHRHRHLAGRSLFASLHRPRTGDFIPKRCILSGPSPPTGFSTPFTHVFFVHACASRVSFRTVLGLHFLPLRVSPVDAWRSR